MNEPFTVHCGDCSFERVLGYTPMPVDVFAALAKLPCGSCGSKRVLCGPMPKSSADGDYIGWLSNGDTGISSKTIWRVMTGRRGGRSSGDWDDVPHDPDDFGRCYRLLQIMPSWRERLPEVAKRFPEWAPLVEHWDELTTLYEEELPRGRAPKLYKRMQQLLERVGR